MLFGKPPYETPEVKQTYKQIKANEYVFPDNVPVSNEVIHLIENILVLDPSKRLTLDEILDHPFLSGNIPKSLPVSSLACPPPANYLSKYKNKGDKVYVAMKPRRLRDMIVDDGKEKMNGEE